MNNLWQSRPGLLIVGSLVLATLAGLLLIWLLPTTPDGRLIIEVDQPATVTVSDSPDAELSLGVVETTIVFQPPRPAREGLWWISATKDDKRRLVGYDPYFVDDHKGSQLKVSLPITPTPMATQPTIADQTGFSQPWVGAGLIVGINPVGDVVASPHTTDQSSFLFQPRVNQIEWHDNKNYAFMDQNGRLGIVSNGVSLNQRESAWVNQPVSDIAITPTSLWVLDQAGGVWRLSWPDLEPESILQPPTVATDRRDRLWVGPKNIYISIVDTGDGHGPTSVMALNRAGGHNDAWRVAMYGQPTKVVELGDLAFLLTNRDLEVVDISSGQQQQPGGGLSFKWPTPIRDLVVVGSVVYLLNTNGEIWGWQTETASYWLVSDRPSQPGDAINQSLVSDQTGNLYFAYETQERAADLLGSTKTYRVTIPDRRP